MSTQKGNVTRTRPQKHQNIKKFKNDLHDNSQKMKTVNSLEITNMCSRCKDIIEWKIKYKKYKPLKAPATCVKCHNKNVKYAYHTVCGECSTNFKVCPKCEQNKELITSTNAIKSMEDLLKSPDIQAEIKSLTERKRRTFYRHLNRSIELTSEEEVLSKLKEMSVSSNREGDEDEFSDASYDSGTSEDD